MSQNKEVEKALELRKEGNEAFSKKAYRYAIQLYTAAIEYNPVDHLVFSNRSASYSLLPSIDNFTKGLIDADRCILLNPGFARGYFRRGVALKGLSRCKEAFDSFSEAVKLDPTNGEYKKSLEELQNSSSSSSQPSPPTPAPEDLPVTLLPDSAEQCRLEQTPQGPRCSFVSVGFDYHTVFLDRTINENEGIFNWTIKIKYLEGDLNSFLEIGAAPVATYKSVFNNFLGEKVYVKNDKNPKEDLTGKKLKEDGSCAFFMKKEGKKLSSVLLGVSNEDSVPPEETPVPDEALVSVEADTLARTLSFFVDGVKVPRAISGIPLPLKLGTAGLARPSFTSVSFQRVPTPTAFSSVVCTYYKCRK